MKVEGAILPPRRLLAMFGDLGGMLLASRGKARLLPHRLQGPGLFPLTEGPGVSSAQMQKPWSPSTFIL